MDEETVNSSDSNVISQYASEVIDFSSSYGSSSSISYSAVNIVGHPSRYPQYGDFSETFSMKKFAGCTDEDKEFSLVDMPVVNFHDFITLKFESFVNPKEVRVYETFNPGSVVKILCYCETSSRWKLLYEAQPMPVEKKSRIFTPLIKNTSSCTRILRLEFNHSFIEYYPGYDAVCLVGTECDILKTKESLTLHGAKGIIQKQLENVQFKPQKVPPDSIQEFLKSDLTKFIKTTQPEEAKSSTAFEAKQNVSILPYEILSKVFSFLDLKSLYNCSQVCKTFQSVTMDPLLYLEINLKFYWHLANSALMNSLTKRCCLIQKVDLSCCGQFGSITAKDFENFIRHNGKTITSLRLNSSYFLRTSCIEAISARCKNLTELQLQNYSKMTTDRDFLSLASLSSLSVLNLSRSGINQADLTRILMSNPNLQKLNLAFPDLQIIMDEVCLVVSTYNQKIESLNFWKSSHFSSIGLLYLSKCENLKELDLGWTIKEDLNVSVTFRMLLQSCKNLRKLILSAFRSITEADLEIISHCVNLEYLDLLGVSGVSKEMCLRILENCKNLKLLDISFCENIDNVTVEELQINFPAVSIKKSKMPEED